MANGYRTLSQHLNDLKKENFSLKLRIYFLEERVQQKGEDSRDDVYRRVSVCRGRGVGVPLFSGREWGEGSVAKGGCQGGLRALGPGQLLYGSLPLVSFDKSGEKVGEGIPSPLGCPGWVTVQVLGADKWSGYTPSRRRWAKIPPVPLTQSAAVARGSPMPLLLHSHGRWGWGVQASVGTSYPPPSCSIEH